MIASVEGVVGAVAADSLVIEVGGLGYRVFAAPAVLALAQPGGRLQAPHTYHLVREDQQALYGFRSAESWSTCSSLPPGRTEGGLVIV